MAKKEIRIGSTGPFIFDDERNFRDGVPFVGFRTSGKIVVEGGPTGPKDGVRLEDLSTSRVRNALFQPKGMQHNGPGDYLLAKAVREVASSIYIYGIAK